MSWATEQSIELRSQRLLIRSLQKADIPTVAKSIHDPECWHATTWQFNTIEKIEDLLNRQLDDLKNGTAHPLVYFVNGEAAGITRLMRFDARFRTLEIGGTWIAKKWKRTFVNSELKLALLDYCFKKLDCVRVEFRVHPNNVTSQNAMKRIGGVFEGVLRDGQMTADGSVADTLMYSFISREWPASKTYLQGLIR
jgi:RimJ/RimL family protein N-acetyltransferase